MLDNQRCTKGNNLTLGTTIVEEHGLKVVAQYKTCHISGEFPKVCCTKMAKLHCMG